MSTLMSSDMNLTRPSTRLHAPPGGVSSISFGDAETVPQTRRGMQGGSNITFGDPHSTTPKHKSKSVSGTTEGPPDAVVVAAEETEVKSVIADACSISVIVSSVGVGNIGVDSVKKAAATALHKNGNKINIVVVENPYTVPYVVKKIYKQSSCDVIVVAVINVGVEHDSSLSQILIPELVHFGMYSSVPVIPSVIQCDSILELNALIPQYCESWSRSVDDIMNDVTIEQVTVDTEVVLAVADIELSVGDAHPHKVELAAGQRPIEHGFLSNDASPPRSRQAPGGRSNLVLG